MTERLLDPRLDDGEKREAIEQAFWALEDERQKEARLEAETGFLVRYGDYILERIAKHRDRQLGGDDILVYVRDRIVRDFPGSVIEASPPGPDTFRIVLSRKGRDAFRDYLKRHRLNGKTRLPDSDARQRFHFTPSVVRKGGRVECISLLHPLVRFAADREEGAVRHAQAVAASVSLKALPDKAKTLLDGCAPGLYALAASRWSMESAAAGVSANVRIGYAGADATTGEPVGADLAERMMAAAAKHGRPLPNAAMHGGLGGASRTLKEAVQPDLDQQFGEFKERTKAKVEDRVTIRRRSLDRHFKNKIDSLDELRTNLNERASSAERDGDDRRATSLKNLAAARREQIDRLRHKWEQRQEEIQAQCAMTPETSDIVCLFLSVEP